MVACDPYRLTENLAPLARCVLPSAFFHPFETCELSDKRPDSVAFKRFESFDKTIRGMRIEENRIVEHRSELFSQRRNIGS